MSSTAFSALREAYENDSLCRGCRAIALAGRDFETHSTVLPVLLFFFFAVLRLFNGWWTSMRFSVELVIFHDTKSHQAMIGRHLLPINSTRFRSVKTLMISLTVATLR